MAVAFLGGVMPHRYGDDAFAVALGGGDDVISGSIGEAGFHSVRTGKSFQNVVMCVNRFAVVSEFFQREKFVILRKMMIHGGSQKSHVASRGFLRLVRQAVGIFESGVLHAEFVSDLGHGFGKVGFGITEVFRQNGSTVVGRFDN